MTDEQTFNQHTLVSFNKLLVGDSSEIHRLENEFKSNGWCFIRLPNDDDQSIQKLSETQQKLTDFFARDQARKTKYESNNAFGYTRVNHKEGIKVLTDQYGLTNNHNPTPHSLNHTLQYLATLMRNMTEALKSIILKMPTIVNSPSRDAVELSPLTMLDIVNYFNRRTGPAVQPKVGLNTDEVNCVPHFDPGLFSLSILSTCDGLQLQDLSNEQWIDGPVNSTPEQRHIGVIWLGEAASTLTQNRFKAGIHRVVYPRVPHQARLTIWQEVCTTEQIEPLLKGGYDGMVFLANKSIQMTNQPNSVPLIVKSNKSNAGNVFRQIEYERGLSASKTGPSHFRMRNTDFPLPKKKVIQQQPTPTFLLKGTTVTMKNQPNSVPLKVNDSGETLPQFMKHIENERGLSVSKSGIEHLTIEFPPRQIHSGTKKQKGSFFSNLFRKD